MRAPTTGRRYKLGADPALALMAQVVHGADVSKDRDATLQSPGPLAIADGFALMGVDDQRQLELELPEYDALYPGPSARSRQRAEATQTSWCLPDLPSSAVARPRTTEPQPRVRCHVE